jgi:hypothetical protein
MRNAFAFAAGLLAASLAAAQAGPFLSAQEVSALAANKKWDHVRAADHHKVRWDLRSGGDLYATNMTQNASDSGTWSVNEAGQLCVKWRGRSANRCVHVRRTGEKLQMVDSNDLAGAYGDLTVE